MPVFVSDEWTREKQAMLTHLRNGNVASALTFLQSRHLCAAPRFPLDSYAALLEDASVCVDRTLMLCLMSTLEKYVDFEGPHAAVYFARFSRRLLQELLAEFSSNLEKRARLPTSDSDALEGCALSL